jgi:hypothetical protein
MDIPVFKLYLGKLNLAAVSLPPERQQEMMGIMMKNMADLGAKTLLSGDIFSSEEYQWFGIEWYPNMQALIDSGRCIREINWLQYMTTEVFLGTEIDDDAFRLNLEPYQPQPGVPAPIYKIWIGHFYDNADNLPPEEQKEREKVAALEKEYGVVKHIPGVFTAPYNELWTAWGLDRYPSHESLRNIYSQMYQANWWKHVKARSFLAIATGGTISGLA